MPIYLLGQTTQKCITLIKLMFILCRISKYVYWLDDDLKENIIMEKTTEY